MSLKTSLFNLLLGVDMAAGGLGGIPDLTISAHAGMAALDGTRRGKVAAAIVNFIMGDPHHCNQAILGDLERARAAAAICVRYAGMALLAAADRDAAASAARAAQIRASLIAELAQLTPPAPGPSAAKTS